MPRIEEMLPEDFEKLVRAFGEGCLVVNCTIISDDRCIKIPNFKVEDGEVIRLTRVEAEAEIILRESV